MTLQLIYVSMPNYFLENICDSIKALGGLAKFAKQELDCELGCFFGISGGTHWNYNWESYGHRYKETLIVKEQNKLKTLQ